MVTVLFLRAERERFASSMDSCCVCCGVGYFERESESEREREQYGWLFWAAELFKIEDGKLI